jgi:hypothetical protein
LIKRHNLIRSTSLSVISSFVRSRSNRAKSASQPVFARTERGLRNNWIGLLGLRPPLPERFVRICLASFPNPRPRRPPSSSIGDRGGLLGWKKNEWRKQAVGVSLLSSEKRPRTKDDEEDWDMTLKRYFAHKAEKSQDRATASAYIKHRYRLEAYATLLSGVLSDVARAACRPTVMGWAHCLQDAGNRHSPTRPGTAQSPCNKRHASRNRLWLSFPSSLSLKCNLHLSDVSGTLQSITRLTLRYN